MPLVKKVKKYCFDESNLKLLSFNTLKNVSEAFSEIKANKLVFPNLQTL